MADAGDSKSPGGNPVRVRLSPRAFMQATPASVRLAPTVLACVWTVSCGKGQNQPSTPPRNAIQASPPVAATETHPAPQADYMITGPTVIIVTGRTRNDGRAARGPVDSLRGALELSTRSLREALEKRGVTVLLAVADSLRVATDSGLQTVSTRDSVSYILVARHRRPRQLGGLARWTNAELVEEASWYLFTDEDLLEHEVRSIRHLPPSAFPELPPAFARELDSLHCTVPQAWTDATPHNVIKGAFANRRQTDWAVLCARQGKTEVLVFWGGPAQCPRELEQEEERYEVEDFGGGRAMFVNVLRKADSAAMLNPGEHGMEEDVLAARRDALLGGGHDGIEYVFEEKGSAILYCFNGQWVNVGGGD